MTVQVANHNFSAIGRMFARQNVPAVYERQKAAAAAGTEPASQTVDNVDLSPFAPRPLSEELFSEAVETAKTLNGGGRLSAERTGKMRENRVFNAVSALAAMGLEGGNDGLPDAWPAGLPAPTREELEEARRRLAQRLRHEETASGSTELREERLGLLDKVRKLDLSVFSADGGGVSDQPHG